MKYTEREKEIIQTFYYENGAKGTKEILERCGFNRSIKGICHSESQLRSMVRIRYNERIRQEKAKQSAYRQMLRRKYGSVIAALAAGEPLFAMD